MGSAKKQRSQQKATSSIIKEMHSQDKLQDSGAISMLSPRKQPPGILVRCWSWYAQS